MRTKEQQFLAKVNLCSTIDTLETELKFVHLSNAPIQQIEDRALYLANKIFKLKLELEKL